MPILFSGNERRGETMKTPKIPRGWRRLRKGEFLKGGDLCHYDAAPPHKLASYFPTNHAGMEIGVENLLIGNTYIRKVKP